MPRWPKSNFRPESVHLIETYYLSEVETVTLTLPKTGQREFYKLRLRETHELERPIAIKIVTSRGEASLTRRSSSEISSFGEFFVSAVGEVFFLVPDETLQDVRYIIADYWGKGSVIFAEDLNELLGGAYTNVIELRLDPGARVTGVVNPTGRAFPLFTVFELLPSEEHGHGYGEPTERWVKTDAHLAIKNVTRDSFDVENLADVEKHFVIVVA